jgi:hypothetical protein
VVTRHVDRLDGGDVLDLGDIGRTHHTQNLIETRVHAGAVEGGAALLAGLLQDLAYRLAGGVRMVGVAVPAGDPVGGGDDIDAGLKHFDVEVLVGEHAVKGHHVRFGGDDLLDTAGGLDSVRRETSQLAGVLADLVR